MTITLHTYLAFGFGISIARKPFDQLGRINKSGCGSYPKNGTTLVGTESLVPITVYDPDVETSKEIPLTGHMNTMVLDDSIRRHQVRDSQDRTNNKWSDHRSSVERPQE